MSIPDAISRVVFMVFQLLNEERSHAGPTALDWNCNALPALADATVRRLGFIDVIPSTDNDQ
jgi:hypothetical protein